MGNIMKPLALPVAVVSALLCTTAPFLNESARAETGPAMADDAKPTDAAIIAARKALAAEPDSEDAVRTLVDALARAGRTADAVAEADRFASRGTATAALRAQRGFLRRQINDARGATEDFTAALLGAGLADEQRRNVQAGLVEAQAADAQNELDRAQGDLGRGEFIRAAEQAQLILVSHPKSDLAMRIRIEALAGAGRKQEALADADRFVSTTTDNAVLLAQRGFLRREMNNPSGAAEDFAAALTGDGLTPEQRRNVVASLTEAEAAETQNRIDRAAAAVAQRKFDVASAESEQALARAPNSEAAIRVRIDALSRTGRKKQAVAEADRFIARHKASPALHAQRGYLRHELRNTAGAIEDFNAALAGDGLSAAERRNVEAALAEARTAERQGAADAARARALRDPNSGNAAGWVYAKRGFERRDAGDFRGAMEDFDAALARRDLPPQSVPNVRYARAEAAAMLAQANGEPHLAEASYREFLETEPAQADAWFKLGYLMLQRDQRPQGADALNRGLALRPVGTAYLDAANAYIFANAPLASKFYRDGLDRYYAGDSSLAGRSSVEMERIKNEVVEADATVRTTVSFGGISGRPEAAGGSNGMIGAETRMRFDARYLPAVAGLEAFARGLSGKDANGERETETAVGLRYRPIYGLNLYFGGSVNHFFEPDANTQFVVSWGLGLGSDAYPYQSGWQPYWDFGTFGAWRTGDGRVLEDTRGNLGFMYQFRTPVRAAVGPTVLAVAGYDNQATTQWAAGIGPSVLAYVWLGGDRYRSYDMLLSLQVAYILSIGDDERQRGWRGQVAMTF
ncbi:MAG: hypothetical protein Q8M26_08440 [Pseudolabrys sp.]|nr:hypothetical protein [Pseudolabrys sp.]